MMKPRTYPGVAYFRGRVVVAGGDSGCIHDIEFLRLPADDNDPVASPRDRNRLPRAPIIPPAHGGGRFIIALKTATDPN
ncbi:unnamed protein product [Mesocestoides corti]|uniref:Uncharacterized protein n=1 Tax=Mesocestoides corti TaxID=53468 RepID=A0A0R3U7J8_MESCO|nr:unnamed protein product [Mesocestoides corti]